MKKLGLVIGIIALLLAGNVFAQIEVVGCVATEAAYGVYVYNNYAFVADNVAGLKVIDVTDPETPTVISSFDPDDFIAYDVEVMGFYAFVADYEGYLRVIYVFDPFNPTEIEEARFQFNSPAISVRLYGIHLYVGTLSDGFYVFDVSDPSDLQLVAHYNQGGQIYCSYIVGNTGYFADGDRGLSIMDLECVMLQGVPPIGSGQHGRYPEIDCHEYCTGPENFSLYAGQNNDAGYVRVWQEDGSNLINIQFNTLSGWRLQETHIAFGETLDDIPQSNGNPIPGQFPYHQTHNNLIQFTYSIELDEALYGVNAFFATHATVNRYQQTESAWAGENGFPGPNWAVYFNYEIGDCGGGGGGGGQYTQDIEVQETLDFGPELVGDTETMNLVIYNVGTANLTIFSAVTAGNGFSAPPLTNVTVPPDGSTTMAITFSPTAAQNYTGTVTITSDDPDEPTVIVVLLGEGVAAPEPEIEVIPPILDFGALFIGEALTLDLTITNIGDAALTVSSVTTTGTCFSAQTLQNVILNQGESEVLSITFAPLAIQYYTGMTTILSDDSDEPTIMVDLFGNGIGTDCEIGLYTTSFPDAITYDVEVFGNYAFVANGARGLYILELTSLESPDSIGGVFTGGVTYDVEVIGKYVFLADGNSGLRVYDAHNLGNLQLIEVHEVPNGVVRDLYIRGRYAYIALEGGGMCILDLWEYICCEPVPYQYTGGWWLMSVPVIPDDPNPGPNFNDDILYPGVWTMIGFNYTWGMFPIYPANPYEQVMELGKGYWLGIAHAPGIISLDLAGEEYDGDFTWELEYPWNMIGCPYSYPTWLGYASFTYGDFTYSAQEAAVYGLMVPCMHTSNPTYGWWGYYNGFAPTTTFEPWKGYWFLVLVPNLTMTLPDPGGPAPAFPDRIMPRKETDDGTERDWNLSLAFTAQDTIYTIATLGANSLASDEFDPWFDFAEPPIMSEALALHAYFEHLEWVNGEITKFLYDIREPMDNEQTDFNIKVEVFRPGDVTIGWQRLINTTPADYEFTFIDPANSTSLDMRTADSYIFNAAAGFYQFAVQVTAGELKVDNPTDDLPYGFQVSAAYPNPFNPTTSISYTLPEISKVTIEVYDISGRLVAELLKAVRPAGNYNTTWDAGGLASGIYLVRLKTDQYSSIQKVVLLK